MNSMINIFKVFAPIMTIVNYFVFLYIHVTYSPYLFIYIIIT